MAAPEGDGEQVPMPEPVNPGKPLVAREIAADGVWKRLVTDPLSGALLDHGRTTYRSPVALAEYVRARDVHCRHPGCRRRAIDAELDHTVAFVGDGGTTAASNLAGVCSHHHHLKHDAPGWTVRQHPDGTITWTTPTGHSYSSDPYDYRVEPGPDVVGHVVTEVERRQARASDRPPAAVGAGPPPF